MHGSLDEVAILSEDLMVKQIQLIMTQGLASALAIEPRDKLSTNWETIKANHRWWFQQNRRPLTLSYLTTSPAANFEYTLSTTSSTVTFHSC